MTEVDPVLEKFRAGVRARYGARLEWIVLFGSRARGDARPDSDYDVAVFLEQLGSRWQELKALAPLSLELLDEHDAIINAVVYPAGTWRDSNSPLMHEIRREGRDL